MVSPRIKRSSGFTLMELMIVVVIVAILLSIVGPGFYESISRNKRQNALQSTLGMLNKARGMAASQATTVVACASTDDVACSGANTWELGYILFLDNGSGGGTPSDFVKDPNEPIVYIGDDAPAGVTIRARSFDDNSQVVFDPQGMAAERGTFQVCDKSGSTRAAAVILNRSGQPRIAIDESGDGIVNIDTGSVDNVVCP